MSFDGYIGNPKRDKWAELFVEVITVIATMGLWSFQAGCWLTLALVSWRILNIGKDMV